jgi:hypothetical protein
VPTPPASTDAPRADTLFGGAPLGTGLFGDTPFGAAYASTTAASPRPAVVPPPGFGAAPRTPPRRYGAGDPRARVRALDVPGTGAAGGAPPSADETAA